MTGHAAVGVDYYLSSGKTCVSVRSADHKTSGRIDVHLGLVIYEFLRKDGIKNVFFDILVYLLLSHIRIMLG